MSDTRTEFHVARLSPEGHAKVAELGEAFTDALTQIERLLPMGRERALVVTKLQEAHHWARRAIETCPVYFSASELENAAGGDAA